jgi:Zn-finger nucleic acid-binding protein
VIRRLTVRAQARGQRQSRPPCYTGGHAMLVVQRHLCESSSMKCPKCGEPMRSTAMNSVEIDLCEEHGLWLDKGELGRILKAHRREYYHIQRSSIQRQTKDAKRRGRIEGIFLGWLSLFFPE